MAGEHIEIRSATGQVAADGAGVMRIKGTAIRWGDVAFIRRDDIALTEEFAPGAFAQSLAAATSMSGS